MLHKLRMWYSKKMLFRWTEENVEFFKPRLFPCMKHPFQIVIIYFPGACFLETDSISMSCHRKLTIRTGDSSLMMHFFKVKTIASKQLKTLP